MASDRPRLSPTSRASPPSSSARGGRRKPATSLASMPRRRESARSIAARQGARSPPETKASRPCRAASPAASASRAIASSWPRRSASPAARPAESVAAPRAERAAAWARPERLVYLAAAVGAGEKLGRAAAPEARHGEAARAQTQRRRRERPREAALEPPGVQGHPLVGPQVAAVGSGRHEAASSDEGGGLDAGRRLEASARVQRALLEETRPCVGPALGEAQVEAGHPQRASSP